jgi:hypothetical protein
LFRKPKAAQAFSISCPEQRAPNGVAVKALRPLTRSGSARALTSDAYFDAPTRIRKLANKRKTNRAVGLDRPRSFRNELGQWRLLRSRLAGVLEGTFDAIIAYVYGGLGGV